MIFHRDLVDGSVIIISLLGSLGSDIMKKCLCSGDVLMERFFYFFTVLADAAGVCVEALVHLRDVV